MFQITSNLQEYVDQTNRWNAMFGNKPALSLNSASDRQKIASMIDSELSPENLTCDGELSYSVVNKKFKALSSLAKKLSKLDPSVKFYEI